MNEIDTTGDRTPTVITRAGSGRRVRALVSCLSIVLAVASFAQPVAGASRRGRSEADGPACVPTATGPVPITASSPGFMAVFQAAPPSDWVDQEFFVSCSSPTITYKTAVFIRRPEQAGKASGVVAVDPLHSAGIWGMQTLLQPYFTTHGVVHVGVAASNDTAERIVKGSNPERYASVQVPATPEEPNEILAGVGALLHQRSDPLLPGIRVKSVVLGGWSQTSVVTRTFISSPQDRATVDGHRAFDGFFPAQPAVGSSGGAQVKAVPDIGVPVLELEGERELLVTISIYGSLGYRRPDSKTYRLYEVPGMSHINNQPDNPVSGFAGNVSCDWPPRAQPSAFRQTDIWAMAFDNLVRWISTGVAPPHAPRIVLELDGKTVDRDARGNALGGVRSVFVDAPTASIMPTSLAPGGVVQNPCAYVGYQLDFSPAQLQALYRTHNGYVRQVIETTTRLMHEHFLLPEDARRLTDAARQSSVLR